jgi:hypothetical protein
MKRAWIVEMIMPMAGMRRENAFTPSNQAKGKDESI